MDYQRSTGQQPLNCYDQAQRASTSLSDRSTAPYSSSRRPVEQRPTGRYGQDQRPTEDSSRSSSSDYSAQRRPMGQSSANHYGQRPSSNQSDRRTDSYSSADTYGQYQRATGDLGRSSSSGYSSQRRPTGQPSVNQYGQHPSPNSSNQSDRRSESYAPSRRPVEQRPAERYGQYQQPTQDRNQRPSTQQSVNPADRHGQYQRSVQESRPRPSAQSNQSSVSNPNPKNISKNQSADHHNQYVPNKNKHRKFSMKTIIIGIAALLVLSVFAVIRMNRDGGDIPLATNMPGEAEVIYNYIDDDLIVKKELIGTELTYESNNIASGTMKYRFKSVTAYDNVYELCGEGLKDNIDNPEMFKLDKTYLAHSYFDDRVTVYEGYSKYETYRDGSAFYHYEYPSTIDLETGKLRNDCHIFVFEIELINVNALSNTTDTDINTSNEFRIMDLLKLVNRSGEKPYYGDICYFAEEPDDHSDSSGLSYHVIINPGETKTIHLGYFLIGDESEHPYSRMGLANEDMTSTYDDNTVFFWFDMSDVISKDQE